MVLRHETGPAAGQVTARVDTAKAGRYDHEQSLRTGDQIMSNDIVERLKSGLLDLDRDATVEAARSVAEGQTTTPVRDAVDAISDGLQVVGKRFQEGEWFLAELVYAGEIAREVMNLLSPLMAAGATETAGTIVVGTVAGDMHDLGKNIFINQAKGAGFKVVDLGIDVPCEKFVASVKENAPLALGMSCLLTSTDREIGRVVDALKEQDVRDNVKVIIGGAALTEQFAKTAGADAFAPDAVTGTDIIKRWSAS
jgi:methanogenic corrinoid protein MtbC1